MFVRVENDAENNRIRQVEVCVEKHLSQRSLRELPWERLETNAQLHLAVFRFLQLLLLVGDLTLEIEKLLLQLQLNQPIIENAVHSIEVQLKMVRQRPQTVCIANHSIRCSRVRSKDGEKGLRNSRHATYDRWNVGDIVTDVNVRCYPDTTKMLFSCAR